MADSNKASENPSPDPPKVKETISGSGSGGGGAGAGNSNGIPRTKHSRGVSWDALVQGLPTNPHRSKTRTSSNAEAADYMDDGISAVTQPDPVSVSLKDVAGIAPIESEAETLLLSAIEEAQPATGTGTNALNDLTAEEDSLFQPTSGTNRSLPKSSKRSIYAKSARADTTAHLWELASTLTTQHQRSQDAAAGGAANTQTILPPPHPLTPENAGQSELLALHAANLLSHRKVSSPMATAASSAKPPASAGSKWKKLQTAVQVNSAMDYKKKDDAIPSEVLTEGSQRLNTSNNNNNSSTGGDVEQGSTSSDNNNENNPSTHSAKAKKGKEKSGLKTDFEAFRQWVSFKKTSLIGYIRKMLMFAILPSAGIAALLFYFGDNPPCGTQRECLEAGQLAASQGLTNITDGEGADILDGLFRSRGLRHDSPSVAWWILFIGVRQVITLSLAMMMESIVIEYWVLRAKSASIILGPYLSLFIVQAKGWPIRLIFWGLLNFGMLYGDRPFARHWLYWQDEIELFNRTNPGGNVTTDSQYKILLSLMCAWGGLIAAKRFYVGLRLGQKTYVRYAADLAKLMKKAILVSEVANLANEVKTYELRTSDFGLHTEIYNEEEEGDKPPSSRKLNGSQSQGVLTAMDIAALASEQKIRIAELLGEWEEPELAQSEEEAVDIGSIIQFRQSLSYLNTQFPFGVLFGPADTREKCVRSTETIYKQLKLATPSSDFVVFDTLALTALHQDGALDDHKLREMIKVFRPDRDGKINLLDFCKSVDAVYKELRLFRASVANSARVDRSFEKIINFAFYLILGCFSLAILGIDPLALFAAISGFILGFAFMIGGACSKYFEGLLMILITKPYDIGDKIQVAPVTSDSSGTGSPYWLVKDVGLYHTTYMFWTQETATCPNGTLANTRIINASRSPQAIMITMFKFPIDTPYNKIEIFKATVEKFVKARPREWLSFLAFRPTRVEADGGFVEYVFVAQHRENWANVGALKNSLADVSYFSLELTKRMGMRYVAPPLPINLNMMGNDASWSMLQRQMAPDVNNQSDRLSQAGMGSSLSMGNAPSGLAPAGNNDTQEYDFSDIEAMFDKNQ